MYRVADLSSGGEDSVEGGRRCRSPYRENRARRQPTFSVVTICKNKGRKIGRCLASVSMQTFRDYEHIVIDGGSVDGTLDFLRSEEVDLEYFVSQSDEGIYDALNKGLKFCWGKYIVALHADDFFRPDALESAWAVIMKTGDQLVLGDSIYIDEHCKEIAYKPARYYGEETVLRGIVGAHEAAFVSADLYEQMGGYDTSYAIAADFKFLRNCVLKGVRHSRIGTVVTYKEIGGESFDPAREKEENLRLLREVFPSASDADGAALYELKNHRNLDDAALRKLSQWLRNRRGMPAELARLVGLSLVGSQLGDGPEITQREYPPYSVPPHFCRVPEGAVILCIGTIKGIAGGAERVLVELANALRSRGYRVCIACADGRAGFPFYRLSSGIPLVDILESPVVGMLQNEETGDLAREISELIDVAPEEFLEIALAERLVRERVEDWSSAKRIWEEGNGGAFGDIRSSLRGGIDRWLRRYENRVLLWRAFLRRVRPSVVVPFMISSIQQVFLANRDLGLPLFLSNHNNPLRDYYAQDDWDPNPVDRFLRFQAVYSADKCHWLLGEYVMKLPPSCRRNAFVLGNPVKAVKKIPNESRRMSVVLAVGRLTAVKDFAFLIRAFNEIGSSRHGWRLRIFGDGPEKEELRSLVKRLKLEGCVELKEPTHRITVEYCEASVFASSSLVEGFPLTLTEAMAHGLPAIGRFRCSGVNSIIKDGENGVLVKATEDEEVSEYAKALGELLRDREKRCSMGQKAHRSLREFSPDRIYGEWDRALEEMMIRNETGGAQNY